MVRMVRSLADRTFQPAGERRREALEPQVLRRGLGAEAVPREVELLEMAPSLRLCRVADSTI